MTSKDTSYEQLDLNLFCAGYLGNVIADMDQPRRTIKYRLQHLEKVLYFSKLFEWKSILLYNESVFNEIERGARKWSDLFTDFEFLLKPLKVYSQSNNFNKGNNSRPGSSLPGSQRDWYCARFQSKDCAVNGPHSVYFTRDNVFRRVEHFCAYCWMNEGVKREHPAQDCPAKKKVMGAETPDKS